MIVTVLGATGKTGKVATLRLLAAGVQVRAVARTASALGELTKAGAQAVVADAGRSAELTAALRGADAVYTLIPPHYSAADPLRESDLVSSSLAAAISESGVKRVVFLSSIGADVPSGVGPITGLHKAEQKLKALPGLDLLLLRPGYFYENHFGSMGLIKGQGVNGSATAPNAPMVMIAAQDIGEAAASALTKSDFSGTVVRELFGPRDLTMAEATTILGKAIGKPDLAYVQFPDDGVIAGLKGAGFSEALAKLFVEMSHGFNTKKIAPLQKRAPGNTGPTTFEAFAQGWAQAYKAS